MKKVIALCLIIVLCLSGCASQDELDAAYERGYEDGYDEGYKTAYSEIKREMRPVMRELRKASDDVWKVVLDISGIKEIDDDTYMEILVSASASVDIGADNINEILLLEEEE